MKSKHSIALFFIAFLCACGVPTTQKNKALQLVRKPYLQNISQNSVYVAWKTNHAQSCEVRYGISPTHLSQHQKGTIERQHVNTMNQVLISNLEEGKKYYYAIYSNDSLLYQSEKAYFETAKKTTTFRFFAMGDIGRCVDEGGFPHQTAQQLAQQQPKPDFGIGLGDNVYMFGESSKYDKCLFQHFEGTFQNTPFYPALGNHDWYSKPDKNFEEEWILPHNEHYYSFDYGNAHFIALDTKDGGFYQREKQIEWFEQELKKSQGKYDWIFVYLHHNGKGCTYKEEYSHVIELYPILTEYQVDMLINGHAHTYERLHPYDKNGNVISSYQTNIKQYPDIQDGFISITAGAAGLLKESWQPSACDKKAVSAHEGHFCIIDIEGKKLKWKTISSSSGNILDEFEIDKSLPSNK